MKFLAALDRILLMLAFFLLCVGLWIIMYGGSCR